MKFDIASHNIISRLKDIIKDFEKTQTNKPKTEHISTTLHKLRDEICHDKNVTFQFRIGWLDCYNSTLQLLETLDQNDKINQPKTPETTKNMNNPKEPKTLNCPHCNEQINLKNYQNDHEEFTVGPINGLPHIICPKCKNCIGCNTNQNP